MRLLIILIHNFTKDTVLKIRYKIKSYNIMKQLFTFLFIIGFTIAMTAQGSTGSTTGTTSKKKTTTKKTSTKEGGTTEESTVSKKGWLTHDSGNYKIKYPSDWELDESGTMFTTFILFAPLASDYDAFKENINLMTQDLSAYGLSGTTLDQYVTMSLAQMPNIIANFYLVSSTTKTENGRTYQEVIYTGKQMNYSLKWKQHVWLENNGKTAYILSFTAEQTKFEEYEKTCTAMMKSCQK